MKKAIALVLCVVLAFGMFACAKKTPASKLEQIKEAGVLVVGTSPDYPPYEFVIAGTGGDIRLVIQINRSGRSWRSKSR